MTIRTATPDDIPSIRHIAEATWPETYGAILTQPQIGYMLNIFYSPAALRNQMDVLAHTFIVLEDEDRPVAFASYSPLPNKAWKLHKIYILPDQQGKGLGKKLIDHIAAELKAIQAPALLLNVNRFNKARTFYEKLGFAVVGEEDIDIGQGFFMNDYIMQLSL